MNRRQGGLGYRLAFAWHFAGGRSLGNFTVIAGLSHPSYIHIFFTLVVTGGSVCYITGGMVSGKSSHKKCRSAKCSHYPPNFQTKLFFSPPMNTSNYIHWRFPVAIFDDRRVYHMFRYVEGRAGRYIETM